MRRSTDQKMQENQSKNNPEAFKNHAKTSQTNQTNQFSNRGPSLATDRKIQERHRRTEAKKHQKRMKAIKPISFQNKTMRPLPTGKCRRANKKLTKIRSKINQTNETNPFPK